MERGMNDQRRSTFVLEKSNVVMLWRLCLYGFFVESKPSEPYLNQYLTTEKGFTNQETNDSIYPWWTYGNYIMLVLLPIFVEKIPYKTVLLIEAIGFLLTRSILLWGTALWIMQVMQITYAVGTASKIVYLSYMYREMPKQAYHKATAVVWSAQLAGKIAAGFFGQILVSRQWSLVSLNYISLISVGIAFFIALSVPNLKRDYVDLSIMPEVVHISIRNHEGAKRNCITWPYYLIILWMSLKCCESLIQNYIQNLWTSISDNDEYNGLATAGYTLAGFAVSLLATKISSLYRTKYIFAQGLASFSLTAMIVGQLLPHISIYWSYIFFVLYGGIYYGLITNVSAELALTITTNDYGKKFALVSLGASILESVFTFICQLLQAPTANWFIGIASFHFILFLFIVFMLWVEANSFSSHSNEIESAECTPLTQSDPNNEKSIM